MITRDENRGEVCWRDRRQISPEGLDVRVGFVESDRETRLVDSQPRYFYTMGANVGCW